MARMPAARWVGEHGSRLMLRYDIVCVHTIVGAAPAHAAQFSTGGGGTIWQSRDTRFQSAANLNGNYRILAVENEDTSSFFPNWGGDGRKVPPLTDAQVDSNARILHWANELHGIPMQLCPNSRSESRGLAYHRQGIDGNFISGGYKFPGRVAGGEIWTEHFGKVCAGDARIAQLPEILAIAKGKDTTSQEDEDMAQLLEEDIYKDEREVTVRAVLQRMDKFLVAQANQRKANRLRFRELRQAIKNADDTVIERLDELEAAVLDEGDSV